MGDSVFAVEVLNISDSLYYKGSGLKEHTHNEFYQIFYVAENSATFIINGKDYCLQKNMFAVIHPNVSHGIAPIADEKPLSVLEVKFLVYDSGLIDELRNIVVPYEGNNDVKDFFNQIVSEAMNKDIYYNTIIQALVHTLLYKLIRQVRKFCMAQNDLNPRPVTVIKEYIDKHFSENISLENLGRVSGYTKNYLCKIFRENTRMTINSYLNTVRITSAAELLVNTEFDIEQISKITGYNNVYHFIKTFKKIVGISPGNYRKSSLTAENLYYGNVEGISSVIRAHIILQNKLHVSDSA